MDNKSIYVNKDKYLKISIIAAIEAGEKILSVYNSSFNVSLKSDNSPLTLADKTSHNTIISHLIPTGIPILSEEGNKVDKSARSKWKKLWIVDPLDGTKEFIKRNDEFTVNIALVDGHKSILGVVYCPPLKTLYFASNKIKGAYKISLSDKIKDDLGKTISNAKKLPELQKNKNSLVIVASRSHMNNDTSAFIEKLKEKHEKIEIISKGSSLKLCKIAEGYADIYPRFAPTYEWDTAAADAIVRLSGGYVLDTKNRQPLKYNKVNLLNPWFIATSDLSYLK